MSSNVNVGLKNLKRSGVARRLLEGLAGPVCSAEISVSYTGDDGLHYMSEDKVSLLSVLRKLKDDDFWELATDLLVKAYRRAEGID